MKRKLVNIASLLIILTVVFGCSQTAEKHESQLPNIVVVLVDDMGYGDAACYNSEGKTYTPNIDQLAQQGMRFTNAHAPGTTCCPSRYGLLTGEYPFRNERSYKEGLIEPGKLTLARLLKNSGYYTACVGKWHQGIPGEKNPKEGVRLNGGPTDHGFDYFFGMPASLDIPPYYYIENGKCVVAPTDSIERSYTPNISPIQGAFWRKGKIAPGYKHENVVVELGAKAVDVVEDHLSNNEKPLFLYFALPSPHTPWLPNEQFKGKTSIGDYGDYIAQTDAVIGNVLKKLKELGEDENTLIVLSSDNGPVWYPEDVEKYSHNATGGLRGMKGDAWEGGHRMPFVVKWTGKVKANSINSHLACFTDLLATFAEVTEQELPESKNDSYSLLSQLTGEKGSWAERQELVLKGSKKNSFCIIKDNWKYIDIPGSGGFSGGYLKSKGIEFKIPKQLYKLDSDIGELNNLYETEKEKASELASLIEKIKANAN